MSRWTSSPPKLQGYQGRLRFEPCSKGHQALFHAFNVNESLKGSNFLPGKGRQFSSMYRMPVHGGQCTGNIQAMSNVDTTSLRPAVKGSDCLPVALEQICLLRQDAAGVYHAPTSDASALAVRNCLQGYPFIIPEGHWPGPWKQKGFRAVCSC